MCVKMKATLIIEGSFLVLLAIWLNYYTKAASNSLQGSCMYVNSETSHTRKKIAEVDATKLSYFFIETNKTHFYDEKPVSRNIIGGTALPEKAWPFLVAIMTNGEEIYLNGKFWDLICGGTLIHPQYILTAAHCFGEEDERTGAWRYLDAATFIVRLGEYNLIKHRNPSAVTRRIINYQVHPDYTGTAVEAGNDVAIAKLEQPVAYNDWIKAACLPQIGSSVPSYNTPCLVAGWGSRKKDGSGGSAYPRIVTLPASSQPQCFSTLDIPPLAQDGRLFCAGDPSGVKDSCSGDSGGPTFCLRENDEWELTGVVSFGGEDCADSEVPGAYTTVSYHMNWIKAVITGSFLTKTTNNRQTVLTGNGSAHLNKSGLSIIIIIIITAITNSCLIK